MKFSILILAGFLSLSSFAQSTEKESAEKESKWDVGLDGMISISAGKNFYAFNAGGSSFSLRLRKDLKFGVGAMPSFYFRNGKPGCRLGVGPRIDYRKMSLVAPAYYFESTNKWIYTLGVGYRFGGK